MEKQDNIFYCYYFPCLNDDEKNDGKVCASPRPVRSETPHSEPDHISPALQYAAWLAIKKK
jgi:hypothetical protein